jgi:hypothetical protein
MPACNTEAMNLHLAEIAATVAPAADAILLVDRQFALCPIPRAVCFETS